MLKSIIFDIGGVLVNDTTAIFLKSLSEHFDVDYYNAEIAVEEALEDLELAKTSEREFCRRVAGKLGVGADGLEKIWSDNYVKNVRMDKSVKNLIQKLKKEGFILAVLSNTVPSHADYNKEQGFYEDFDIVLLSSDVGLKKPDKRFFELALERLNLAPQECAFIDDKERYVGAAKEIGIYGVHYNGLKQLEDKLRKAGMEV